jgi:hypothetical protein
VTLDVLVSVRYDEVLVFKNVACYVVNNGANKVDGCSVGLGGCRWVDAISLHKEGLCGSNVAMSGVLSSRFEVNQWHEGFCDCRVDELDMGQLVLGASLALLSVCALGLYGVGHGLCWGGAVLNDGNACRIIIISRSDCVVLMCWGMLG